MVRREGTAAGPAGRSAEEGVSCCIDPAGESPVRVISGEGSPVAGHRRGLRSLKAKRGVKSPQRRKPEEGSNSAGRNIK